MNKIHFEYQGTIVTEPDFADDLDAFKKAVEPHLDRVMEELIDIETEDPAVGVDYEARTVTIEIVVDGKSDADAIFLGLGQIRTAIHAAGGMTPDWDIDWVKLSQTVIDDELLDA